MPIFTYEAIDAAGTPSRGTTHADTLSAARSQLRAQGLIPLATELAGAQANASAKGRFSRRRLNAEQLAIWTRQLAGLLAAGMTLERALAALESEMERPQQGELVAQLRVEVSAGHTFADALSQYPREFPAVYRAVIAAGEQGGAFAQVLESLADTLEQQQNLRDKLVSASVYPAIVTLIAFIIVVFLLTYVVPQIAEVFAGGKRELPLITRAMLAISAFIRNWGWLLALLLAVFFWATPRLLARGDARRRFDAAWLRLPLIGRLARGYNASRFAATLALLVQAGVPIIGALQAARETLSNHALMADAGEALSYVREGAPIAAALDTHRRFPALLIMFIRQGEQTGELGPLLTRAASQLANDAQRRALRLAAIAEPLLITTMGVVVMFIVMAVLMPIIELNTFVQ